MEGFTTEVADDGRTGVERVRDFRPDVILLDIMMKNMNGLEVLQTLKASPTARDIPVIVLSNISDMRIVNEAKAKGAIQFVVKSETEPATMVAVVKDVLSNTGSAGASYI